MLIDLNILVEAFKSHASNVLIHLYFWLVLADILTGWTKAFLKKEISSNASSKGLIKHGVVSLLLITIYPYLYVLKFEFIANSLLIFFMITYGTSLVENLGEMGFPLPKFILDLLIKLKDKADNGLL